MYIFIHTHTYLCEYILHTYIYSIHFITINSLNFLKCKKIRKKTQQKQPVLYTYIRSMRTNWWRWRDWAGHTATGEPSCCQRHSTSDKKNLFYSFKNRTFSSFAPSMFTFFSFLALFPAVGGAAAPLFLPEGSAGHRMTRGTTAKTIKKMKQKKWRRRGRGKDEDVEHSVNTCRRANQLRDSRIQKLNACYKFTENLLLRNLRFKG